MENESELKLGEFHPSAADALAWFQTWKAEDPVRYIQMREVIASTAMSGNRLAQVCHGTLERLANGDPISDRYLLGLCWFLRNAREEEEK